MAEGSFFAMGGYAGFVWPAYAIAFLVIGGLIVQSVRSLKAREREAATIESVRPRRQRRRGSQNEATEAVDEP